MGLSAIPIVGREDLIIEKLKRRFPEIVAIDSMRTNGMIDRIQVTCCYRGQVIAFDFAEAMRHDPSWMIDRVIEFVDDRIAFMRETIDPWCRWNFSTRIGRCKRSRN